jgi:hypothetical protein
VEVGDVHAQRIAQDADLVSAQRDIEPVEYAAGATVDQAVLDW